MKFVSQVSIRADVRPLTRLLRRLKAAASWFSKRSDADFFSIPASSADIWFLMFRARHSQSKPNWLEVFPPYADEKIFRYYHWVHSSSLPLCDHSKAHYRPVAAFGLTTTELVPHHWAESHGLYFGNASLRETLILNGCIPTLIHKSNRDYNLSLPLILW